MLKTGVANFQWGIIGIICIIGIIGNGPMGPMGPWPWLMAHDYGLGHGHTTYIIMKIKNKLFKFDQH